MQKLEPYAVLMNDEKFLRTAWTAKYVSRQETTLIVLQQQAEQAGLRVESVQIKGNRPDAYELELAGSYHGLIYFLNTMEQVTPIIHITLQSVEIGPDHLKIRVIAESMGFNGKDTEN